MAIMSPSTSFSSSTLSRFSWTCRQRPSTTTLSFVVRRYYSPSVPSSNSNKTLTTRSSPFHTNHKPHPIQILPEVSTALTSPLVKLRKPVVALESTLFAHGMPYPQNLQLAKELISIIKNKDAIPAIIAIKNGTCHVGLTNDELEDLTLAGKEGRAQKISTRDIPLFLAKFKPKEEEEDYDSTFRQQQEKQIHVESSISWGATTVASTMHLAHLVGIKTFVTGGIGGVHRGGQDSMDISADLQELANTPVVVVSAGIKSILDIRRTLEMLETLSVPTVTYQSNEFPAFFSPRSGIPTPTRVDTINDIARAYQTSIDLGLPCGMLVAIPNQDPVLGERTENAIQDAIRDANQLGIQGQNVTPFILKSVAVTTDGDSLRSNMALVKRNASIGADIAHAIFNQTYAYSELRSKSTSSSKATRIVIMGGSVVDIIAKPDRDLIIGSSTPGSCHESFGGVGRNIAETLGRLGVQPYLYSAVGADHRGAAILKDLSNCGVLFDTGHSINVVEGFTTSTFLAMLDARGDLHAAIADMRVLVHVPAPSPQVLFGADFLVIDANASHEKMLEAAQLAVHLGVSVFFEPTSVPKAKEACKSHDFVSCLSYASPNAEELIAMAYASEEIPHQCDRLITHNSKFIHDAAAIVLKRMMPRSFLIVTLGPNGVLLASKGSSETPVDDKIIFTHFHAVEIAHQQVMNTTGGGDSFVGAFLKAIIDGKDHSEAISYGQKIAVQCISYQESAISPFII